MNYPPPPPPIYGPPISAPPPHGVRQQQTGPPSSSSALGSQSGLTLQNPSQIESMSPYTGGGYAGPNVQTAGVNARYSPKSQNYYSIERQTPTPSSATSIGNRSLSKKKTSSRITPALMPRPERPQTDLIYHTRSGAGRRNPPVVNSLYVAIDSGNVNPRFIRPTMVAPPATPELQRNMSLPFSLHVTPFASIAPGEETIPEVSYEHPPLRCKRCESYMSPYITWSDNGSKWSCPFCETVNVTPEWYISNLDGSGQRIDRSQRPEFTRGSVDYILPDSLFVNEKTKENILVFAIDVSLDAVQQGFTLAAIRSIQAVLRNLYRDYQHRVARAREQQRVLRQQQQAQGSMHAAYFRSTAAVNAPTDVSAGSITSSGKGNRSSKNAAPFSDVDNLDVSGMVEDYQIGIFTFHHQLQFYDVRWPIASTASVPSSSSTSLDAVRVMVGEVDDPFCPLPKEQLLHRFSSLHGIDKLFLLLEKLPTLLTHLSSAFSATSPRHSSVNSAAGSSQSHRRSLAPAAAVVAVEETLRVSGGRVFVFASHHSTVGVGSATSSATTSTNTSAGVGVNGLNSSSSTTANNNSNNHSYVSNKATRETLAAKTPISVYGTPDEFFLYACPGAPHNFLDGLSSSSSSSSSSTVSSASLQPQSTPMWSSVWNNLATTVTGGTVGVNNAGNGIDRKVSAVSSTNTTSSSGSTSSFPASTTTNHQSSSSSKDQLLRKARCEELLPSHQWYWSFAQSCVHQSALAVSFFVGLGDLYNQQIHHQSDFMASNHTMPPPPLSGAIPSLSAASSSTSAASSYISPALLPLSPMPSSSFVDTTHFSDLALHTGGKVFLAGGSMLAEEHVTWMENQLAHELLRGGVDAQGKDVTLKLRVSRHWSIDQFYGAGLFDSLEEKWKVPIVDASTSAMFSLRLISPIKEEDRVCLQLAALYTAMNGQRRLRVHNLQLIASDKPSTVYRNCDVEAMVGAVARIAAARALQIFPAKLSASSANNSGSGSINDEDVSQLQHLATLGPRSFLQWTLVQLLVKYRALCSSSSPKGQLVLPEALKVMPMYVLGLLKHPAFVENPSTWSMQQPLNGSSTATPRTLSQMQYASTPSQQGYYPQFDTRQNIPQAPLIVHASERAVAIRRLFSEPLKELINSVHPRVLNLFAIMDMDLTAKQEMYAAQGIDIDEIDNLDDEDDDELGFEDETLFEEELSPEKEEDRSQWTVARSTSQSQLDQYSPQSTPMNNNNNSNQLQPPPPQLHPSQLHSVQHNAPPPALQQIGTQGHGQMPSSYSSTRLDMLAMSTGYAPLVAPVTAHHHSNSLSSTGVYGPPSVPPPPSSTVISQPPTATANNSNNLGSNFHHHLAGYAMADAVYSDYSSPVVNNSNNNQLPHIKHGLSVVTTNESTNSYDNNRATTYNNHNNTNINKSKNQKKSKRCKPFRPLRLHRRQGGEQTARRLKLLALQTLQATSAEFDSDQIYVIDDRSVLWLYVGHSVPVEWLEELFDLPRVPSSLSYAQEGINLGIDATGWEKPNEVAIRRSTMLGKRLEMFLDLLASDAPYKQDIKVIWADANTHNPLLHKFSSRLLEDASTGIMSYTDFLCSIHNKIQALI